MSEIALVTDSNAYMPPKLVEQHGVNCLSFRLVPSSPHVGSRVDGVSFYTGEGE